MRKRDAERSGGERRYREGGVEPVDEADRVDDEAGRRREEEEDKKKKNQKPRDSNPSRARSPREELAFRVRVSLAASEASLG